MMEMENKIFVLYVGVAGIRTEDIESFVRNIAHKITPSYIKGEIITIPVQSPDTKIECINPKYITNSELIKEHEGLMKKLNDELKIQSEILKESNNNEK